MIGITETWWDNAHDSCTTWEGCNLFKRSGLNRKGGGVALYMKKKNTLSKNSAKNGNPIKSIWVTIQRKRERKVIPLWEFFTDHLGREREVDEAFPIR